jgi:microtubule-associated protein-like 1/2
MPCIKFITSHAFIENCELRCVISLNRYPCLSAKAEYNEEKVYTMQIATARFMYNDKNVVTAGGTDATLILWDVIDD